MQFSNDYLDLYDHPATLTEDEIAYFRQTADAVQAALGIKIEITNRDHEREMTGKSKEAYGIFYTSDPKNPALDCFITIDNFFIHECYEEKFLGKWNLSFETLESVLCHEIAHMTKFRHGKGHTALTQEYLAQAKDYMTRKTSLDQQISNAKSKMTSHIPIQITKNTEYTKE